MNVTLSKGGSRERTVRVNDITIPEIPAELFHSPTVVGCHAILLLAHAHLLGGCMSPVWQKVRVPDLWHIAEGHPDCEAILDIWHLTHDLVRELQERSGT